MKRKMLNIDLNEKRISGYAKVRDIKKYGLVKASLIYNEKEG